MLDCNALRRVWCITNTLDWSIWKSGCLHTIGTSWIMISVSVIALASKDGSSLRPGYMRLMRGTDYDKKRAGGNCLALVKRHFSADRQISWVLLIGAWFSFQPTFYMKYQQPYKIYHLNEIAQCKSRVKMLQRFIHIWQTNNLLMDGKAWLLIYYLNFLLLVYAQFICTFNTPLGV